MSVVCPNCQKDDKFTKVAAYVHGGSGYGPATDYRGYATTARFSSDQAEILGLPRKPKKPATVAFIIALAVLGFVFTFCIISGLCGTWGTHRWITEQRGTQAAIAQIVSNFTCPAVILVIALGLVAFWVYSNARYNEKLGEWQQLVPIWERLFYCQRCDMVADLDRQPPAAFSSRETKAYVLTQLSPKQ